MSAFEDIVDAGLNVGVMALSQHIGKEAEKSLNQALEREDFWGILFSAGVYGASAYVYQSSARKLSRLIGKYQLSLPAYELRRTRPRKKAPAWYLPKKGRRKKSVHYLPK